MRTAILIGQRAGKWEAISLPNNDVDAQRKMFRSIRAAGGKGFDRVELWTSSVGRIRRFVGKASRAGATPDVPEDKPEKTAPRRASK